MQYPGLQQDCNLHVNVVITLKLHCIKHEEILNGKLHFLSSEKDQLVHQGRFP